MVCFYHLMVIQLFVRECFSNEGKSKTTYWQERRNIKSFLKLWFLVATKSLRFPWLACTFEKIVKCDLNIFWWVIKTLWSLFQKTTSGWWTSNRNFKSVPWMALIICVVLWKTTSFKEYKNEVVVNKTLEEILSL